MKGTQNEEKQQQNIPSSDGCERGRGRQMRSKSSRNFGSFGPFLSVAHVFELPHFVEGKSHNESNQRENETNVHMCSVYWMQQQRQQITADGLRGRIFSWESFWVVSFFDSVHVIVHINFQSIWFFVSSLGIRCGASKGDGTWKARKKKIRFEAIINSTLNSTQYRGRVNHLSLLFLIDHRRYYDPLALNNAHERLQPLLLLLLSCLLYP